MELAEQVAVELELAVVVAQATTQLQILAVAVVAVLDNQATVATVVLVL